mmetsp:Transcript_6051/g.13383  ORF Transcript_6051/g.13383 Transcript_6051/m.13383 type:complete len:222 (-) Transcript_6051:35-700(-)
MSQIDPHQAPPAEPPGQLGQPLSARQTPAASAQAYLPPQPPRGQPRYHYGERSNRHWYRPPAQERVGGLMTVSRATEHWGGGLPEAWLMTPHPLSWMSLDSWEQLQLIPPLLRKLLKKSQSQSHPVLKTHLRRNLAEPQRGLTSPKTCPAASARGPHHCRPPQGGAGQAYCFAQSIPMAKWRHIVDSRGEGLSAGAFSCAAVGLTSLVLSAQSHVEVRVAG